MDREHANQKNVVRRVQNMRHSVCLHSNRHVTRLCSGKGTNTVFFPHHPELLKQSKRNFVAGLATKGETVALSSS